MTTKQAVKARELNLDALLVTHKASKKTLCTVGELIAALPTEYAKAFQANLANEKVAITTLQKTILRAGLPGRGWHSLSNHREGICICAKAGN